MNEYKLTLTEQEVNILIAGLGKLPLEVSIVVWQKIKQQVESQQTSTDKESV